MSLLHRAAVTGSLLLTSALTLTGPVAPTYAAAAVCQGQAATIEGAGDVMTGTSGSDVIVATNPAVDLRALGGDDLICVVGGTVETGEGNDSVVSTAPASGFTGVTLRGGNDSYLNTGAGRSRVDVLEVTGLHVDLGAGGGDVWLYPTTTPGTGSVDLGAEEGRLFAVGESEAHVDLAHGRAGVDDLLTISIAGVYDATASGAVVRMTGNAWKNDLAAYGCDVVVDGGDGRDVLHKIGPRSGRGAPGCSRRHFHSILKGGDGPDRLSGRATYDVLIGGRGRDVVDGRGGRDRCVAEVERSCEW